MESRNQKLKSKCRLFFSYMSLYILHALCHRLKSGNSADSTIMVELIVLILICQGFTNYIWVILRDYVMIYLIDKKIIVVAVSVYDNSSSYFALFIIFLYLGIILSITTGTLYAERLAHETHSSPSIWDAPTTERPKLILYLILIAAFFFS